jgi:hypothetical protein
MSIIIGEVVANISGNVRPFEQAMDGTKRAGERAASGIEERFKRLNNSIAAAGGVLSKSVTGPILALGTALFATTIKASNMADEIDKMAIRSGLSRERLQELKFATDQVGVSMSDVETAVDGLRRRLVQVDDGTGRTGANLERLGVSTRNASGELRSMDDLFPEIVAGLGRIENETERGSLAVDIFGRSASNLAPLLAQGADGIEQLTKRARELGLVMSDESVAEMVAFKDAMSEIKDQAGAMGREIALSVLPIIKNDLIPFIQNTAIPAIQSFVQTFRDMDDGTKRAAATLLGIAAAGGPVLLAVAGFNRLALAIKGVTVAMMANPYMALAAGIGVLLVGAIIQFNREAQVKIDRLNKLAQGTDTQKQKVDELVESVNNLTLAERQRAIANQIREIRDYIAVQNEQLDALKEQEQAQLASSRAASAALPAQAGFSAALRMQTSATEDLSKSIDQKNEEIAKSYGQIRLLEVALIETSKAAETLSDTEIAPKMGGHGIATQFQPAIDKIAELDEEFQRFLDTTTAGFDTPSKIFPPGSLIDIQNQIRDLNELMMLMTDPKKIAVMMEKIEGLREQFRELTGDLNRNISEFERFAVEATDSLSRGLAQAVVYGKDLKSTLNDIIRQLASKALQQFLMFALTGGTSAGAGIAGGLLGRVFGVGDALIKSNGDVVQFHPNDNIMAWQNNMPMMGGTKSISLTVPVMIDGRAVWTAVNNYEIDL